MIRQLDAEDMLWYLSMMRHMSSFGDDVHAKGRFRFRKNAADFKEYDLKFEVDGWYLGWKVTERV